MEHIRQFDWCSSEPDRHFVIENDLDNCVTEKILRNKFYDPMFSSDSEDEEKKPKINWDEVFKKKNNNESAYKVFVPGLRRLPPYPKVSALNQQQHLQCLKVICSQNPTVLSNELLPKPTKLDFKIFEQLKQTYEKEQKEYIEWAKSLWANDHCIRMLRPKPSIETVYEAEFKMKAHELQCFPKIYQMAGQIPLENIKITCELVHQKDLISVNLADLPQISYPEVMTKKFTIMRPSPLPEPCTKHPCRFTLPGEKSMSILPLTEIHKELAQYATDNGADYVFSENSLKCLLEMDRFWSIPISVCQTIGPGDEKYNVVVMGNEFSLSRESPQMRTHRAYRHLLEYALIPPKERIKSAANNSNNTGKNSDNSNGDNSGRNAVDITNDNDSSDDENLLFIDDKTMQTTQKDVNSDQNEMQMDSPVETDADPTNSENRSETCNSASINAADKNDIEFYSCMCKDTIYEEPPKRSYTKWQVKNKNTKESHNIIIHCSHKAKGNSGEVVLEPITEYQIDLGASVQSSEKIKSLALSLLLRRNASLLNVRVDSLTGDVVTYEYMDLEEMTKSYGDVSSDVAMRLGMIIDQLQGLLPGRYVLRHEPGHGVNALLWASRAGAADGLALHFDCLKSDDDEAKSVKTAPTLTPVLLPFHKFRKILPCAFTPHASQVAKETKKPVQRQKTPPQALKLGDSAQNTTRQKWPKSKSRKRKKK